jgi:iron complex outermembrane recepter protein
MAHQYHILPFVAILMASVSSNALAQKANESLEYIDEIVVTAQKREERLVEVPISVAVVGGDNLRELNLNAATDLQYVAPGLGLGDANTPRGAGFRVRGVGTNVFADGIEQSVGTVVDGVPLARAGQGLSDLVDVDRIEVLRGPQGMLFGRNASAGLINIVTRNPDNEFGFDGRASYGSGNDIRVGASLTGPIVTDTLAARLTGFYNTQDGFVTNIASGQRLNNRKEYGLRGALLFTPSETLDIIIRSDWSKRDNRANIWTIRALPSNALSPLLSPTVLAAVGPESQTVNLDGQVFNEVESWGVSAEVNVEIGDYTLTSVTAYRDWQQGDNNDADQSTFNVLNVNFGTNGLNQLSQELRLTSPEDQLVSFVAGLFYYRSSNVQDGQQIGKFAASFAQAGAFGVPIRFSALGVTIPGDPVAIAPTDLAGRTFFSDVDVRDLAAFGQATINISDTFKLIAGGRFTDTKVSTAFARGAPVGTAPVFNSVLGAAFAPLSYDVSEKDQNFSWRLGAQYLPDPNTNFYATVSRGYKGPGFNQLPDFTLQPALAGETPEDRAKRSALVRPEIATSYELGFKKSFADRRVNVELALYQTDFKDFQAQVFETPAGATLGSFRIRNAGKLRSKGFEASVNVRPTDNFTAGFSLAYNDTKYVTFLGAACPRSAQGLPGNVCTGTAQSFDASGLDAPNAPKLTLAVNSRYDAELSGALKAFVQGNIFLRSANYFSVVPKGVENIYHQPSYAVVNGSIGIASSDDSYSVGLFVKNLFDTNFVNGIFDLPFGGAGDLGQFVTRDSQRTWGVSASAKF